MNMRVTYLLSSLLILMLAVAAQAADRPNIVFIYADDLGYGDISIYNPNSQISTPNIDRLAKEGLRFTDAHSSHATCTGSRYGLLTGTSSARSGVSNKTASRGAAMDQDEITIADFLRDRGYTTQMVGKWHLGFEQETKEEKVGTQWGSLACTE